MGKNKSQIVPDPPWSPLWALTCKLRGVGELLRVAKGDEACFTEEGLYGLGTLILEIADDVSSVLAEVEQRR